MTRFSLLMRNLWLDERGQDLLEYVLILGLIVLAISAGMTGVAGNISDMFTFVGAKINTYTT